MHSEVPRCDAHPDYVAAKGGDADAALLLVLSLLSFNAVDALRPLVCERPCLLLPVIAEETAGFNAIPDALAQVLSWSLRLPEVARMRIMNSTDVMSGPDQAGPSSSPSSQSPSS